jgi:hypothetical protein
LGVDKLMMMLVLLLIGESDWRKMTHERGGLGGEGYDQGHLQKRKRRTVRQNVSKLMIQTCFRRVSVSVVTVVVITI